MPAKFNDFILGPNQDQIFITFEAGPTHNGLESAKRLIDITAKAKANAIKFQMFNADRVMADKKIIFNYKILKDKETNLYEDRQDNLYELLKKREFTKEQWSELKRYADNQKIHFFCTAAFPEEVDFLVDQLKISSIKIASADIDHLPFIRYVAQKNVNIQLDTGSGNLWEIERAVRTIEEYNNNNVIIHHCPTGYPALLESINLKMIKTLRMMFPEYPIAFSDHSPGIEMNIAAIALGARLIEKTITFDCTTPSIEHCFSLEPSEAIRFVQSVKDLSKALGSTSRLIPKDILESRKKGRRSIYTNMEIIKGNVITNNNIDFKRPGYGISPFYIDVIIGKKISRDLPANHMITWEDLA